MDNPMSGQLSRYQSRYGRLLSEMSEDWTDLIRIGQVQRALDLRKQTGEPFRSDVPPQFFVGDLDANVVLVHLNPKQHDTGWSHHLKSSSFEEYVLAQRWFGRDHYGPGAPPWHSPFDHKQILFVEPFGVIDFAASGGDARSDRRIRLERVIDQKLQLELIPYSSPSFRSSRADRGRTLLNAHYERVMSVITAVPREYVIFCGAIFERLIGQNIVARRDHEFRLEKQDGTLMRDRSRFSQVTLTTPSGPLTAGIAQSWARQGIPMSAYACAIKSLY